MKRYAQIEDNIVNNICNFPDEHPIPDGWMDVTEIDCNINWPIINGVPTGPPSKWHTIKSDNLGYEITPDNQTLKDSQDAEKVRSREISQAQISSGMKNDTVLTAQEKISDIFDNIREKPTDSEKLGALINKCEAIFKKIAVELLR